MPFVIYHLTKKFISKIQKLVNDRKNVFETNKLIGNGSPGLRVFARRFDVRISDQDVEQNSYTDMLW
jgi:2-oxoglutarate dehydrogenase E1 component